MKKNITILLFLLSILLAFTFSLITTSCIPEKEKSVVVVTFKKYMPPESGDAITSEREKFLLYIKRINKSTFTLGSKTYILETDKESYDNLNIHDTLKNKY